MDFGVLPPSLSTELRKQKNNNLFWSTLDKDATQKVWYPRNRICEKEIIPDGMTAEMVEHNGWDDEVLSKYEFTIIFITTWTSLETTFRS